jgi:hypothetical protein
LDIHAFSWGEKVMLMSGKAVDTVVITKYSTSGGA